MIFFEDYNKILFNITLILLGTNTLMYSQSMDIKPKPITINGSASVFSAVNSTNDTNTIVNPFTYGVNISPTISVKDIKLPFHFSYINGRSAFSYPFLRMGAAPSYKWLKIYIGNNTVNWGRYSFSGQNVFGAGFEINPKKFHLGFIKGRITPAIFIDSTRADYNQLRPRYSSHGFAIRTGYKGRANRFLFTYFNGSDKVNSLEYINPKFRLTTARNSAIGADIMLSLSKQLLIQHNSGLSFYTRDNNAAPLDTFLRSTGREVLPSGLKIIEGNPNISTQLLFAYDNMIQYATRYWSIGLRQKEIRPDFKSLGLRFINNDIREYSAETSVKNKKNSISLNFNVGIQQNNLNKKQSLDNYTTIYSANLSYNPNEKFWLQTSYSNFGILIQNTDLLPNDSISLRNINGNFSLNTMYYFQNEGGNSKSLSLNINHQNSQEVYEFSPLNNVTFKSNFISLAYGQAVQKELSFNSGINYHKNTTLVLQLPDRIFDIEAYGVFGTINKPWGKDNKLNTTLNGYLNMSGVVNDDKKPAFGIAATAYFMITEKWALNASYNYSFSKIGTFSLKQNFFNTSITAQF